MKLRTWSKKLLAALLLLALLLSLTACGTDNNHSQGESTDTSAESSTPASQGESQPSTPDGSGTQSSGSVADKPTATDPTVIEPTATDNGGTAVPSSQTAVATKPSTPIAEQQTVDAAFRLGVGATMSDVTLTGVVTYVKEVSESYGNATFDLQVQGTSGAKTIHCYRIRPADGTALEVTQGQTLTISGTIQNYKGTIEFVSPSTYYGKGTAPKPSTPATNPPDGRLDVNGVYDSKEDVGLYIHLYGKLPKNFVKKSQYNKETNLCCGGDRFYNKEGLLPNGFTYYECDIDTLGTSNRGAKRLVYTLSGIVYYTSDHYRSFTKLYDAR